jgi:hypothetical protein
VGSVLLIGLIAAACDAGPAWPTNLSGRPPGGGGIGGGAAPPTALGTWRVTRQISVDIILVTTLSFSSGSACSRSIETVDLLAGRSTTTTTACTWTQSGGAVTVQFTSGEPPLGTFTGTVSGTSLTLGGLTFTKVG